MHEAVSCRTPQAVDLALPCPLYCQKDSNTSQLRGGGRGTENTFPSNPPFTSYITIHSMNTLDQIYTSYQTSTAPVLTTTKNFVQAN